MWEESLGTQNSIFLSSIPWLNGDEGGSQERRKTRCRWLTLVILATQEAEIRRIVVRIQSGQIVHEILS
jgi:hypothetical protein